MLAPSLPKREGGRTFSQVSREGPWYNVLPREHRLDILAVGIASGFVPGKHQLPVAVEIEHSARGTLQFDVIDAFFLKFRPDTQGLGFVASSATVFDQDLHGSPSFDRQQV